jgi:Sec7-like guanine-nucleotide exchange factor
VTGLSLHVFVALLNGFKDYLKAELEVFITNIFLRILESENSTFDHKSKVLEVFQTICKDPAALVSPCAIDFHLLCSFFYRCLTLSISFSMI